MQSALASRRDPPSAASIRAEARRVVLEREGAASAISGPELVHEVTRRLELGDGLAEATVQRRCQEAVAELAAGGVHPVRATAAGGYYIAKTPAERNDGRQELDHRLVGVVRRYATYDPELVERLLAVLRLQGIDVDGAAAAPSPRALPRPLPPFGQLDLLGGA